jgi:hypothetical protein
MPFEEKLTWVNLLVSVVVPAVYFARVLGQLGEVAVPDIAYQRPMLIAVGVSIVLTIVGTIVMAIGTGISSELSGRHAAKDIDRKDERDAHIGRRGELVGYYVASVGAIGVMALTMLEYDYFWIANALYLSFVAASLVSGVVKLVAYRRGF